MSDSQGLDTHVALQSLGECCMLTRRTHSCRTAGREKQSELVCIATHHDGRRAVEYAGCAGD